MSDTLWSVDSIQQPPASNAVLFESRQQRFAVTASYVQEVIEAPDTTAVPGAPWWYCGIASHRSKPVPVIDPIQYFAPGSRGSSGDHTRAVVVNLAASTYLFAVEKIVNLCQLDADFHSEVYDDLADHSAVASVHHVDGKSVALIDIPEFLRQVQLLSVCG